MEIQDFELALHSTCMRNWFVNNVNNLIRGKPFQRENEITKAIVGCLGLLNVVSQNNYRDILDNINGDVGEAAHNGTFQSASDGIEHIIKDYYKRLNQGAINDFYGLIYLMDIENLPPNTIFTKRYINDVKNVSRPFLLQTKYNFELLLNRIPGKVRVHEPFHNLKSPTESTILNYDIYIVKMNFNRTIANTIYTEFNKEEFFKRVGFAIND